ncbi:polysaccharide deacetylase family protein [Streptomyces albireticuli]|uniref:polysaccharide deacetylase family protein n=1 Tax=Streptomyces albireticuli TaxID=1940 RepID=UPI00369752C4
MPGSRRRARSRLAPALAALVLALVPTAVPAAATAAAKPKAPAGYDHHRCGNTSGRVLLTLDDWSYGDDDRAVTVGRSLQRKGIRAAFFLVNSYASRYPKVAAALHAQGHWVGNHTWSHPHLRQLSEREARAEIRGGVDSTLLRPPYGDFGDRETRLAEELGYRICTWTVDTRDWEGPDGTFPGTAALRATVRDAPAADKRSGVVLGHLFSHFPEALPGIIDDLRDQGYRLCRNTGPTTRVIPYPLNC